MWTKLKNFYGKLNPKIRLAVQTVVVGAVVYFAQDLSDGDIDDWEGLWLSVKVSTGFALLAVFTPLNPFVGPNFSKPDVVAVPSPPAVDEDSV